MGYGELVQILRMNKELGNIARTQGIHAVLNSNDPTLDALRKSNKELVTTSEKEAEQAMTDEVKKKYPDHAIVGEEHGYQPGSSTRWVFDPIDGTSAMIRTALAEAYAIPLIAPMPAFGITVAMVEGNEAVIGVVGELVSIGGELALSNLYTGALGTPTTCNGITLPTPPLSSLSGAQLACTVPKIMFGTEEKWSSYQALLEATGNPCLIDQNCIGYMQLIKGGVDIVFEADLAYHDAAALVPILKGAGIEVTDQGGNHVHFPEGAIGKEFFILAAQPELHGQALAKVYEGVPKEKNRFVPPSGAEQGYAVKFPQS